MNIDDRDILVILQTVQSARRELLSNEHIIEQILGKVEN